MTRRRGSSSARDVAFTIEAVAGTAGAPPRGTAGAPGGPAESRGRSVAVLFFKDLAGNPENAYLGLGLADSTITELSLLKSLLVRPTAAILRYQDGTVDPAQAGRELGVDAVVNGSFQRSGSRLRVTVQLIATADGRALWGSKIDTSLDDLFQMQDEVSRKIVQALEVELSASDERRLARAARPGGKAYEMYLKGRFHMCRRRSRTRGPRSAPSRGPKRSTGAPRSPRRPRQRLHADGVHLRSDGGWQDRAEATSRKAAVDIRACPRSIPQGAAPLVAPPDSITPARSGNTSGRSRAGRT